MFGFVTANWKELTKEALSMGYRSHKAGTCGLHCHVNRNAFGETEAEQDAVIARILFFVEKHWTELLKFSRRTPRQLERWASRYGYKDQPHEILDHAKKGGNGRYTCVNLTNEHTIEFRMFNSTLHAGEVKSYIQLCLAISHQALVQRTASRTRTQSTNEKYTFRTWLLRLGMIGDEFKTARQHLLKNLDGNIAWRDPAQAQEQRERQMRQRLEQQSCSSVVAAEQEVQQQRL